MKKINSFFIFVSLFLIFNLSLTAQKPTSTELKAIIAGISSGDISKDLLLKTGEISCTDPNFKVISFTLSLSRKNDIIDFSGNGYHLSVQMKDAINGIDPNNKISIEKIIAKNEKGEEIHLPAMVLILK
jgi:hypothetical protein